MLSIVLRLTKMHAVYFCVVSVSFCSSCHQMDIRQADHQLAFDSPVVFAFPDVYLSLLVRNTHIVGHLAGLDANSAYRY